MDRGIADVRGDGGDAVLRHDGAEQLLAAGERLLPADLMPLVAVADQGHPEAILIVVQAGERGPLGAQVAPTPHVFRVAADLGHPVAAGLDDQATHRLAERTRAKVGPLRLADPGAVLQLIGRHVGDPVRPGSRSTPTAGVHRH